jgi:hypothetical protein
MRAETLSLLLSLIIVDQHQDGPMAASSDAVVALRRVAEDFFVPRYFASVGLGLDLRHHLDLPLARHRHRPVAPAAVPEPTGGDAAGPVRTHLS